jgi:tetratricopeptide (TPR) repeat protein
MERFDQFTLDEKAGTGGLADVWRARNEVGEVVALKVLRDPDRSSAHRARFMREGRLLQRMEHPGLPRCMAIVEGPRPYLVLEFLEGETLAERIRRTGPLTPDQVATVASAILRVLAHLHDRGVIHRDVKASNIFLSDDRRVLVLDLGLAADPTDPLTTTLGDVMGTYAYMAPEQIAGAEVDHRCDVYSVGVTLYEALAGARPFHARGAAGYLQAHREGLSTPLSDRCPDAPTRLVDAITRMMARDPAARPASAAIALAMLTATGGVRRSLDEPPLVGRSAALGAIQAVLDAGGILRLTGELGSGLGRVTAQALRIARRDGCETLAIRCRARVVSSDPLEQIARDLTRFVGQVRADVSSVSRALSDLCGEGPVLLLVEDVEQCDLVAAAALQQTLERVPMLSVVLAGVEVPKPLSGHEVRLRPLTRDEVQRLVVGMLGASTPPAGLTYELHRLSGGLPAIVVLAVKELVARGALWCEGVSDEGEPLWRLDRAARIEPTAGLDRLFGAVLSGLPEDARALLDVLAVAGESLPVSVALELAHVDPSGIAAGPLLVAGLASRDVLDDEEWLALRRAAVGALVAGRVGEERQAELHRGLAAAYAAMPRDSYRDQRVAWHAAHGALGGDAAAALLALGESLSLAGQQARALEVLGRATRQAGVEPLVAARLAIARGEALDAVGRRVEARDALSAARRLAEDLGDSRLKARALVGLAQVNHALGDESRTAVLIDEAMALLEPVPDEPSLPRALLLAANSKRVAVQADAAAALYRRCIEIAMAQGQREYAAMAHGGLGTLLAEDGHLEDAARHLRQESSFLRTRALPQRLVGTLVHLAITLVRMGQVIQAIEALDEADEVARYAELHYDRAQARVGRAAVHLCMGDLRGATHLLAAARIATDPEASTPTRLFYREVQADLRMAAGDRQAALAAYQSAEIEATRGGYAAQGAYFLGMIGVLTADPDALTDAMEVLGRGGDRRLAARLLFAGATVGGDAEVLETAERETRESNDLFLLLEVLHASGGSRGQAEGQRIARRIYSGAPRSLRVHFRARPEVRWCGLEGSGDGQVD